MESRDVRRDAGVTGPVDPMIGGDLMIKLIKGGQGPEGIARKIDREKLKQFMREKKNRVKELGIRYAFSIFPYFIYMGFGDNETAAPYLEAAEKCDVQIVAVVAEILAASEIPPGTVPADLMTKAADVLVKPIKGSQGSDTPYRKPDREKLKQLMREKRDRVKDIGVQYGKYRFLYFLSMSLGDTEDVQPHADAADDYLAQLGALACEVLEASQTPAVS